MSNHPSDNASTDALMQTIGTIFAVTVLLDKRQRDEELVEFCNSVMSLNQRLRPGHILPRPHALNWYFEQKPMIQTQLATDVDDHWKTELLNGITDPSVQKLVMAAIFAICICDYDLQDEEAGFLKLALSVWNTGLPNAEELAALEV